MNLAISHSTVQALPKLVIGGCVCSESLDDHGHCSHHPGKCCHCDCTTSEPARYLVPHSIDDAAWESVHSKRDVELKQ